MSIALTCIARSRCRVSFVAVLCFVILALAGATGANAQTPLPTFSKSFSPGTIGPGSTTTLQFDLFNPGSPVTGTAFVDVLPAGVTIATPSSAFTDCEEAQLSAPDGGTTITLIDGRLGAGVSCVITVNVTSSTPGVHTNTTGDFTSSAGNSGTATADLTVSTARPGFSKSFSPVSITPGGTSTLTLAIDNSQNASAANGLGFTDVLPAGMSIATPANLSSDCPLGTLTATSGGTSISYFTNALLAAGASCSISVDVTTSGAGNFVNTSGELTTNAGSSGFATAALNVAREFLTKAFTDDPVAPGGTVTLAFTIANFIRGTTITDIAFTDDLDAVLSGLVAVGPLSTGTCNGSLSGTSTLSYSGGSLASGASCSFSVTLQVPATAAAGSYTNTTSAITFDSGGTPTTGNIASDALFVQAVPTFTKEFTDDPVSPGDPATLEFTITNTDANASLTGIAFIDELTTFLPLPLSVTLPPDGFCGAGSSLNLISLATDRQALSLTGGNLAGGESCTFSVIIDIPSDLESGSYTNITSTITGQLNGETVEGFPATDDLVVIGVPNLTKDFVDDPVAAGSTVTLAFTLEHAQNALGDATNIAFDDDLDAVLTGLAAVGLPLAACGGTISGTSLLSFTGGSLSPGEVCSFSVTLNVPATAPSGTYTNTTTPVTATIDVPGVGAVPVIGREAQDDLEVIDLRFTKEFVNDPVLPGQTVTLRFTIENFSTTEDATGLQFSDNLSSVLSGLVAVAPLPSDPCGPGSTISGTSSLSFSGGSVSAGTSCTFDVTLQVPTSAAPDTYNNTTSALLASIGGTLVGISPATDQLTVADATVSLVFSKEFTSDPVTAGGDVVLEFTISYEGPATATDIAFTDDLNAVLSGLAVNGPLPSDPCGAGSQLTGTSTLTLSDGTLAPGGSCTFSVTLQVPASTAEGSYLNTTSDITGLTGAEPITGSPASDIVQVLDGGGVRNRPPVADAGPDQTAECVGPEGAPVTLDGSGSTDPDNDPLIYTWTENGEVIAGPTTDATAQVLLAVGVHTIVLTVNDGKGESDTDEVVITVEDTQPPVITLLGDNPLTLECGVDTYQEPGATAIDACQGPVEVTISGVVEDEVGTYTVTYTATDGSGNLATETRTVEVVDTTPPDVTAELIGQGGDDDDDDGGGSGFEVLCTATDACDEDPEIASVMLTPSFSNPQITFKTKNKKKLTFKPSSNKIVVQGPDPQAFWADVQADGGVEVVNGQVLKLTGGDDDDDDGGGNIVYAFNNQGNLKGIKGGDPAVLRCTATDDSGNSASDEATPSEPGGGDDDDDDGGGDDDDDGGGDDDDDGDGSGGTPSDATDNRAAEKELVNGLAAQAEIPETYELQGNYPNPFNPETRIRFGLPEAARVELTVYDMLGRRVRVLADGVWKAGTYEVVFRADDLPSGTYLYRLKTPEGNLTGTMLLLK